MDDVNLSDPKYFPETIYVYHLKGFPSSFSFVKTLSDLPNDVVFVGRYELKNLAEISHVMHYEEIKQGE